MQKRRPWQEELSIVDRTMKAISGITDPEQLISVYWENINELIRINEFVSISRRGIQPPEFLVTRSSRFTENFNPWTQRDRLPRMSGGLLGELAFAERPVMIDDLPSRLAADDPGWFYLQGYQSLIALPQYDDGLALNMTALLFKTGEEIDRTMIPAIHLQSGLFGRGTQNLVLRNKLGDAVQSLDREMQAVGEIQRSLLPEKLPVISGFELSANYKTSARAGGDYYDFFQLDDSCWGLFIADVSGHGTPAAVLMAITHAIAHAQPLAHRPPSAMLQYLNDRLAGRYTRAGTFVTAFYAVLDPINRTLTYARAGHNPPRLMRGNQVISIEEVGGLPMGIQAGQIYRQADITLQRGDQLLLYTDGISEAMSPVRSDGQREMFGLDRLDQLLIDCESQTAAECIERIKNAVSAFSETSLPSDDQTLIAIRCM